MRYIIKALRKLKDPRQPWKVKHSLVEILAISIIAVMCGATSSGQIEQFAILRKKWLKKFLRLEHGIPHRLTIERTLTLLDPRQFQAVFNEIMQQLQTVTKGSVVALDGKCFHCGKKEDGTAAPLYMVSAWCNANNMVLGHVQTREKSNEMTAIPELLKVLKIPDCIVTIDAIGCQKEIVKQIKKEKKADYCISLKENQPTLCREMRAYADDCLQDPLLRDRYIQYTTQEKGHGRKEKRTYTLFSDLTWYQDLRQWTGLASLVRVDSARQVGHAEATHETRYYITSLTSIEDAARAIRAHWGIENRLHWVLDVVFREDSWATRKEREAANLATIRKLSLSFLRNIDFPTGKPLSTPAKMWACALDLPTLEFVLFRSNLFS